MTGFTAKVVASGAVIREICEADMDTVAGKCWENRETQLRLLNVQEILGMGVWQADRCVGQLHGYKVALPQWDDSNFPGYGRSKPVSWPLGWPLLAARDKGIRIDGPIWAHACFHVGVTPGAHHADSAYFGLGYGTALCEASVQWAREHGYAAVLAQGGSKAVPAYNTWMGCLPWTTYARMGFECVAMEEDGQALPWWAKGEGDPTPEMMQQVKAVLDAEQQVDELCARTMLLRF